MITMGEEVLMLGWGVVVMVLGFVWTVFVVVGQPFEKPLTNDTEDDQQPSIQPLVLASPTAAAAASEQQHSIDNVKAPVPLAPMVPLFGHSAATPTNSSVVSSSSVVSCSSSTSSNPASSSNSKNNNPCWWFLVEHARSVGNFVYRVPSSTFPKGLYIVGHGPVAHTVLTDPTSQEPPARKQRRRRSSLENTKHADIDTLLWGPQGGGRLHHYHCSKALAAFSAASAATTKDQLVRKVHHTCRQQVRVVAQSVLEATTLTSLHDHGRQPSAWDPVEEMQRLTMVILAHALFEYPVTDTQVEDFLEHYQSVLQAHNQRETAHATAAQRRPSMMIQQWLGNNNNNNNNTTTQLCEQGEAGLRHFAQCILEAHRDKQQQANTSNNHKKTDPNPTSIGTAKNDKNNNQSSSLLRWMDESSEYTEAVKLDEIVNIFLTGLDTTGAMLGNALYRLAAHPDITLALRKDLAANEDESDNADDENEDNNRPITTTHSSLYFQFFLKELHRVTPVVPLAASVRTLAHDLVYPSEDFPEDDSSSDEDKPKSASPTTPSTSLRRIPAHARMVVMPFLSFYNPHVFPSPEQFHPLRWARATPAMRQQAASYFMMMFATLGGRNSLGHTLAVTALNATLPRLIRDYDFVVAVDNNKNAGPLQRLPRSPQLPEEEKKEEPQAPPSSTATPPSSSSFLVGTLPRGQILIQARSVGDEPLMGKVVVVKKTKKKSSKNSPSKSSSKKRGMDFSLSPATTTQ